MASVAPGPPAARGAARPRQLPLGEIKSLFIKFLEQQGYAVPQEADDLLDDVVSVNTRQNRSQSPCPSVASSGKRSSSAISSEEGSDQSDTTIKGSDEDGRPFLSSTSKRKLKKVARRQRKNNGSRSSNSDMEVEIRQEKLTNNLDSPASPDPHSTQTTVTAPAQATVGVNVTKKAGSLPAPPPKSKLPPPICLRDKSKWNLVAAECTKLRINYTKAQNTKFGIKITVASIEDFRNLNRYLIKNNLPFHTFALEEERKVKAVIKGIPVEIETENVKENLQRQGYPIVAVHRMHRRDGTALGLVLAILERSDSARAIFKDLSNVCGLSGIAVEPPYRKGMPGQCHRCQLYGHAAANCHAQPRCVKCLVPHWTKDCERKKEAGGKPSCCNCGQEHTANYKGCPVAPKPKPVNKTLGHSGAESSTLGEDISTIMSILQVVKSAEVADLAAKFRKARHGVDRLRIILENQELINKLEKL
ncbi:Nucleic-acid-binding protein from transposon X-element [Eumeta japonica]|uniref:Nucleic-acid-binding protein from transposon X-element n=1 Tax=Eumeta variegata TaxID=151549 RepID=A0A4C1UKC3_EUMVA|nr:Nucleic-acid-binding protein from transposon X-element [Eumeta japonica]